MNETSIYNKAKNIKAVAFDGDGVIFTGRVFISPEKGEVLKERSHIDGQGISFLRAIGLSIIFVSGEKSGFIEKLTEKLNSLPSVKKGEWAPIKTFVDFQAKERVDIIDEWLKGLNISLQECAFMGDDLADYEILKKVGLAAAPAQAEEIIKKFVHYVAPRRGGDGAIRDFCDLILKAKGIDVTTLSLR
ncbi:HAD hydrolase family protein [Patescibacteria group bacterium]|nr:HAD hydrolase family protein [Patescibacteria group bacterium]